VLPVLEIEVRTGHSTPGVAPPALSRPKGSPPRTCCHYLASHSPGHPQPPTQHGRTADSCSAGAPARALCLYCKAASHSLPSSSSSCSGSFQRTR